jgi:2-polyprenyl-3-methyl-5-hydroxy-6-metoxy-1,4-benzoquinol methylase
MSPSSSAAQRLNDLYAGLGDLRDDFRNKNLNLLICSLLRGRSVLDVGSGASHFLAAAARHGFVPEGIEPDADLIALSRTLYGDSYTVHPMRAEDLTSLGRSYDNVTMNDVLEHLEDDRAILRAVRTVLNPGGRLVIVVPQHPWLYGQRDASIGHFRRYVRHDLVTKLIESGYRIATVRSWNAMGFLPYMMSEKILRRPLTVGLRGSAPKGPVARLASTLLDRWFALVENRFALPGGLSLICVAELP